MVKFGLSFGLIATTFIIFVDSYGYKFRRIPGTNDCRLQVNLPGYPPAFPSSLDSTRYSDKFTGDSKDRYPSSGNRGTSGYQSNNVRGQQSSSSSESSSGSYKVTNGDRNGNGDGSYNSQGSFNNGVEKDSFGNDLYGSYGGSSSGSSGYGGSSSGSSGYGSSSGSSDYGGSSSALEGYQRFRPSDVVECGGTQYYSMRLRKCTDRRGDESNSWGDDRYSSSGGSQGSLGTSSNVAYGNSYKQGGQGNNKIPQGGYSGSEADYNTKSRENYGTNSGAGYGADSKDGTNFGGSEASYGTDSRETYGTNSGKKQGGSNAGYSTITGGKYGGSTTNYGTANSRENDGTNSGAVGYVTDSQSGTNSGLSGAGYGTGSRESYEINSGKKQSGSGSGYNRNSGQNYGNAQAGSSDAGSVDNYPGTYGTNSGNRYGSSGERYTSNSQDTYGTSSEGPYSNPGNRPYSPDSGRFGNSGTRYGTKRVKPIIDTSGEYDSSSSSSVLGDYSTNSYSSSGTNSGSRGYNRRVPNGYSSSSSYINLPQSDNYNNKESENYGESNFSISSGQSGGSSNSYGNGGGSNSHSSSSSGSDLGIGGGGGAWSSGSDSEDLDVGKGGSGYDNDFVEEAFYAHNSYRAKHGSPPLLLDEDLRKSAQDLAEKLASGIPFGHSTEAKLGKVGESIAVKTGQTSGSTAVDFWYKEIANYDYRNPKLVVSPVSKSNAHFSAILWNSTKKVGIGKSVSKDGRTYVVATYYPPGNFPDKLQDNVFPLLRDLPVKTQARSFY